MVGTGKSSWRAGVVAALVVVAFSAAACFADGTGAAPLVYVTNAKTNSVSTIDSATNKVVGEPIPVGTQPFSVALTPNGRFAYVVNRFAFTVSVIDTQTRQVVGEPIPVGEDPIQVAVAPDGKTAWVADEGSEELSVIDTQTNQVVRTIPAEGFAWGVSFTPDGKFAYVPLDDKSSVQVIETATGRSLGQIPVGERPFNATFSPDGRTAYVVNNESDSVSVIDTATRTSSTTIPVGEEPWGLALTPDGRKAFVADGGSDTVSVINTAIDQVVKTIPVGEIPAEVAITPNEKTVYVTDSESGDVTAIDPSTNQVIGTPIAFAGGSPRGVAVAPDQSPTAAFAVTGFTAEFVANFDGRISSDPDGTVSHWVWQFGDGDVASEVTSNLGTSALGGLAVHTYTAPGTYNAQLAVFDNEGCGVEQVFTGRTAYCGGNPQAVVTHPVQIAGPPPPAPVCSANFGIGGISHNRKNGTVRLRLRFHSTGWFLLFGKKIHAVTRKVRRQGTAVVTLHARVELNKRLKKTLHAGVKYRITFTPSAGCGSKTVHRSVALVRAPRTKHGHR